MRIICAAHSERLREKLVIPYQAVSPSQHLQNGGQAFAYNPREESS
jgi:hypothetical protein